MKKIAGVISLVFVLLAGNVYAADEIGRIVALKGKAFIEREKKEIEAKLKDGVLLVDNVATKSDARTKMLFVDDSILTIGENTKVSIREFVYKKDDRGKAIFNLIEGKMRTIVGKTNFEVHTPTLVAAARGTVIFFETGEENGRKFTIVKCLEGVVDIRSIDPTVTGTVSLTPGMMINVKEREPLPASSHIANVSTSGSFISKGALPAETNGEIVDKIKAVAMSAPIINEPIVEPSVVSKTTPVTIGLDFK